MQNIFFLDSFTNYIHVRLCLQTWHFRASVAHGAGRQASSIPLHATGAGLLGKTPVLWVWWQ